MVSSKQAGDIWISHEIAARLQSQVGSDDLPALVAGPQICASEPRVMLVEVSNDVEYPTRDWTDLFIQTALLWQEELPGRVSGPNIQRRLWLRFALSSLKAFFE